MAEPATIQRPTDFRVKFKAAGLKEKSRSYRDYEKGKRLLADVPDYEYAEGIAALVKYLWL